MDPQLVDHALVAVAAFAVVAATTPLVRRAAVAAGAVKQPGARHVHGRATPELGGLAILLGVLAAVGVGSRLDAFGELFRTTSEPETVVLAALVVAFVGVIDDLRGLSPASKLAGQVLAASVLVVFGLTINFVYVPLGGPGSIFSLSPNDAALLTVFAVVAMVNAVNLVDGLDGLAAGIVAIAAIALFVYIQLEPTGGVAATPAVSSASLVLAAVVGACLGFLVHNWHPASIFMGDTGAMLLGLLLGSAGVSAIGNTAEPTRADFFVASVPALIPALVLAVPFADIVLAVLRRVGSGQSIAAADKKHLHHRLLAMGHSQRRAVLLMYALSALLAFGVVGPTLVDLHVVAAVAGGGVVALAGALLWQVWRNRRTARALARATGPGGNVRRHPGAASDR
jgi:UDP-GlcNAc:undecaprenyl-phosphate/decaprenyl-phosphate GlcNAc-1-phosphate transferase